MQFDFIVGNPPYSKGTELLYVKFFERALSIADKVVFVMPVDLTSKYDSLKKHNIRVKTHLQLLSNNVSSYFSVGIDNIHYVIADSSVCNIITPITDPLEKYVPILTKHARLRPIKGATSLSVNVKDVDDDMVDVIDKILSGDIVVTKKIPAAKIKKTKKKSSAPYLVVINHTPSKGRFNCAVIKNTGMLWSMSTFAFEASTKKEATVLKEWLQSKKIIAEVNSLLKLKNDAYTITKQMLMLLPNVKYGI